MDDELLTEFLNESREHLGTIETDLLAIEEAGANLDDDLINKVFRAAHSIKGGASFLGLTRVKELAHKAETVLDMLRARKMTPNAEVINVLLAAFDKLREMINRPAESDQADIGDLLVSLTGLVSSYLPQEQKDILSSQVSLQAQGDSRSITIAQVDFERAKRSGQCIYVVDYDLIHDLEKKGLNILRVFRELAESGEILDCLMDFEAVGSLDGPISNALPLRLVLASTLAPELMPELLFVPRERIKLLFDPLAKTAAPAPRPALAPTREPTPAAQTPIHPIPAPLAALPTPVVLEPSRVAPASAEAPSPGAEPTPPSPHQVMPPKPADESKEVGAHPAAGSAQPAVDETLRVSVSLLETLMNLAGELVLGRNQLRSAIAQNDQQSLSVADQRLNQVTSELQDAIMRTRLQPIGNVFSKFPRLVRDLCNSLQKDIQLDVQGKDVALDRSLIEGLSDPLTHMVRNAVDHGVETPAERLRVGKKSSGTVRIEARHEAGQVVVEISDDGKGIDPARVAKSALAKGLITAEKLRSMSDVEKTALILLPGLSTAEKVTDVSGRGVGMDVVKTNLERLGGQIEIKSQLGKGSMFRIKLPLTLAIIPSLIISVGRERFAIPQINVAELLRIRPEEVKRRIEVVGHAEVLLLRDEVMPLVYLDALLGVGSAEGATADAVENQAGHPNRAAEGLEIAVLTTGSLHYGVVVSAFHETEEIVVKPLGRHFKGLREYAGATILGDGAVALILDVAGVAAKANFTPVTGAAQSSAIAEETERQRLEDIQSLLLFHNAPDEVFATPLDTVLRIERITPQQVEMAGNRRTMQYRGASLPLVTLSDAARVKPIGDTRDLAVIVSRVHGREVGLLGAMPVDVVETKALIDQGTHRQQGIAGSAIIRDRTTLITDLFELVDAVYPEWNKQRAAVEEPAGPSEDAAIPSRSRVLLAEDSDFFRAQVKKYLEQDGLEVLEAPDGQAAWELLDEHAGEICAVVTDIEMPRLSGLGLATRIRADQRFPVLPIIALSSLASEDDVAKGKAAGATEYLVKLDRDRLLAALHALIGVPA